jgi:TATA-binding protein-associated factor Taf7
MTIGDVRTQDPNNQHKKTSPNDTTPPAQGLDQDNHEEDVEPNDQGQDENNDQEGDEDDGDKEEVPPHPRVRQSVQIDHPVDNILGDIEKGVTTRSRVVNFCKHYSFISFFF